MTRKENAAELIREVYEELRDGEVTSIRHEHTEDGSFSRAKISNEDFTATIAVGREGATNYRES